MDFEDWVGAIGPQSDDEPLFHGLRVQGDMVRLVLLSPGEVSGTTFLADDEGEMEPDDARAMSWGWSASASNSDPRR